MSAVDDIRAAMARYRADREILPKGAAIFELNRWKGEESRKLADEYARRKAEIDARPDSVREEVSPEVLALVAEAVAQGYSRSAIRIALGKQTLPETDDIITLAQGTIQERVESGEAAPYSLRKTGKIHAKGWPMYTVTMHDTGEAFGAVYLVPTAGTKGATRTSMRLSPSVPGSGEILDRLFEVGVAEDIFLRGKD